MRGHEPYLRIGGGIGWETVYNPIKCYFTNIDITNIKDYSLDKFFYTKFPPRNRRTR